MERKKGDEVFFVENKNMKQCKSKVALLIAMVFGILTSVVYAGEQPWTWVISKKFNNIRQDAKELVWSQETNPFSQAILSFNIAQRPEKGVFKFYGQVRHKETGQWGCWHHMFDWGHGIQRSYGSKPTCFCSYHHVRLELDEGHLADAFRFKVEPSGSAPLTDVKKLFVCLTNSKKFVPSAQGVIEFPSYTVQGVPAFSQHQMQHDEPTKSCSPTSCTMLTCFITKRDINAADFARKSCDNGLANKYGSWPFNMAHAYERCNGKAYFYTAKLNNGFSDIYNSLIRNIPVVVSVRGELEGAPKTYPSGHLLVVVGWDKDSQSVICHDPAMVLCSEVIKWYPVNSFLRAWDGSQRLAYRVQLNEGK